MLKLESSLIMEHIYLVHAPRLHRGFGREPPTVLIVAVVCLPSRLVPYGLKYSSTDHIVSAIAVVLWVAKCFGNIFSSFVRAEHGHSFIAIVIENTIRHRVERLSIWLVWRLSGPRFFDPVAHEVHSQFVV